MLKAAVAESNPENAPNNKYKFACNSVIVQHLVPTSALNKPRGGTDAKAAEPTNGQATSTDGKPHVGRRGMHSAVAAFWNEKEDGMFVHKYDGGESKGLDVIVTLLWMAVH
jgi:Tctex-1 family